MDFEDKLNGLNFSEQILLKQTIKKSPQQIIDIAFSPDEFDRAGRYRIYELCNYIEGILNGTIEIK